jgi:hypothetical protein
LVARCPKYFSELPAPSIEAATKKISWFFVCPKVRHLQYKVRRKAVQNQVNTGICRGCILPVFTWKYPAFRLQFPAKLLPFCAVRVLTCWDWL